MPDDLIKAAVVAALLADGWTITHDPYAVECDDLYLYADLGCERASAGGEPERIVVEVKTFQEPYSLYDLHQGVGQLMVYRTLADESDPGRKFYLAVSTAAYEGLFARPAVSRLRA